MDIENYLSSFDKAEKINKGMAGDEKYRCRRGGEEYLLRIADHRFRESMGDRLAYDGF